MDRRTFTILCHLLWTVTGLSSTEIVDVKEMVVMFLHVLAHDVKNRIIQRKFIRSSETVLRHFNLVLLAVDVLARPNGLQVPMGYYYLRDSGYPNAEGFFTPYRGQRYHLQEWRDTRNALTTGKEYFNMKHSSERNVIKRVFNLLKGR
ncbi:putative nuclease HARBI1 [Cucumis melo var. makuwa]|uniref:Nuclease HARBI1 n=1 Tax=Cucumis melo var. makuwa TaxID=1194695 RepID=A0A5A7TYD7_CUCMM|nr:putative nuclease HARBI1 [Cucumis melo var. makuwa]TYK30525.1 putative nuclease HARBI1 [Cucumis melo var. makuwa]